MQEPNTSFHAYIIALNIIKVHVLLHICTYYSVPYLEYLFRVPFWSKYIPRLYLYEESNKGETFSPFVIYLSVSKQFAKYHLPIAASMKREERLRVTFYPWHLTIGQPFHSF